MQQGNNWLRSVVNPPSLEEVRVAAERGGVVQVAYANGSSAPHALTIRDIEITSDGFAGINCAGGGARVEVFYDRDAGTARVDLRQIAFHQQIRDARGA